MSGKAGSLRKLRDILPIHRLLPFIQNVQILLLMDQRFCDWCSNYRYTITKMTFMKQQFMTRKIFYALSLAALLMTACQKNDASLPTTDITASTAQDATSTIAVVASATVATADSVYIVQPCANGAHRDSIAQADLPAAISAYLSSTYAGYTFHKAFALKDSTGAVTGYAVIVYYNDKPVGLEFDNTGAFVKVLEQRERDDRQGVGFHHGGRFENRNGQGKDTVTLTALPASVLSYFATNYGTDTLVKAYKGIDSSLVILSKNNGVFATVFDAIGNFVKRETLPSPHDGRPQVVTQTDLPAAVTSYLATTYPAYVFQKAFAVKEGDTVNGYVVFIDANNTKYAVAFDAAGTFLKVQPVY